MGDEKNLTEKDFEAAGQTDAIGKTGAVDAKRNMYELLKEEFEKDEQEKPKEQY